MNQEINLAQMQPIVYQQLQRSFEHGRIAHAYLFEGEKGTGKHEVGIWLAQHLFCTQMKDNLPCGKCNNCQRIERKNIQMFWLLNRKDKPSKSIRSDVCRRNSVAAVTNQEKSFFDQRS